MARQREREKGRELPLARQGDIKRDRDIETHHDTVPYSLDQSWLRTLDESKT